MKGTQLSVSVPATASSNIMFAKYRAISVLLLVLLMITMTKARPKPEPDSETGHLSRPNQDQGWERFLGFGVVFPYPYFQRPRYRYPVYDREGRGYLSYGYGGPTTYRYTKFDQREGHH